MPTGTLLVVRIAEPATLEREMTSLGPVGSSQPLQGLLRQFLGLQKLDGVAMDRSWYLFLGRGEPRKRGPWILLPIANEGDFHASLSDRPPGLDVFADKQRALLGRALPELAGDFLSESFESDVEVHVDIAEFLRAYQADGQELPKHLPDLLESIEKRMTVEKLAEVKKRLAETIDRQ